MTRRQKFNIVQNRLETLIALIQNGVDVNTRTIAIQIVNDIE